MKKFIIKSLIINKKIVLIISYWIEYDFIDIISYFFIYIIK